MQLIYLYIENYKNIQNQGFNFTTEFKCDYKDGNLTIDKNENYIENFFGDNIEVSAIVGENGSGKSSVFEIIAKIISNDITDLKYILITQEDRLKIYKNVDVKIIDNKLNIQNGELKNKYYIFHSNSFTSGYFDDLLDSFSSKNYKYFDESKIRNQSSLNQFLNANRVLESYSLGTLQYRQQHSLYIEEFLETFKNAKILMQLDFVIKFREDYLPFNLPKKIKISIQHNRNTASIQKENFFDKVKETIHSYHSKKALGQEDGKKAQKLSSYEEKFLKLLSKFNSIGAYESITLDVSEAKKFVDIYAKIKIKIFDLEWYGLSSGQESLLDLYTLLLHGVESLYGENCNEDINLVIALDEVENNFHPLWQKYIVVKLVEFFIYLQKHYLENYKFKLNIQTVFATHSPFILSDIPKQNIVFLKDGKQIDALEKKQTFGANIHTLLADGFFMDGGLMGEFAKEKIEEVIKFLNSDESKIKDKKEAQKIINIIGEPILKNQLQKMLDSKNLSEVDKIKQEIGKLQDRLEKLENGKN